eukprot:337373_1
MFNTSQKSNNKSLNHNASRLQQAIELANHVAKEREQDHGNEEMNINIISFEIDTSTIPTVFVPPQPDDDIKCNNDIAKCNSFRRIIYLLQYYTKNQASIYEYISSLENYNISILMNDWCHSKMVHFKDENDLAWFKSNKQILFKCTEKKCIYTNRHQRNRAHDIYEMYIETDHKNIVLRDQFDSIHAFLFHELSHRLHTKKEEKVTEISDDESSDTKKEEKFAEISDAQENKIKYRLINKTERDEEPLTIADHIDHKANVNDKNESCEQKQKIEPHMNAVKNINDEENKAYEQNMVNDSENIWENNPESIADCNLQQIIYILQNILDKSGLIEHKQNIIQYFEKNELDGRNLQNMNRKPFLNQICEHFKNNKLKAKFGKLYTAINKFDLKSIGVTQSNDSTDHKTEEKYKENDANSKFITTTTVSPNHGNYYSFGEQYHYTNNLKNHPLYVEPKFENIQQELFEYFKRLNQENDKAILLGKQTSKIESISNASNQHLQQLVHSIVKNHIVSDNMFNDKCWYDDTQFGAAKTGIDMIKLQYINCELITEMVGSIFPKWLYS